MRRKRTMTERTLKGIAAAEGIAIGPAFCYQPPELTIPRCDPLTPDEEMARFDAACRQAAGELAVLKERVEARANAETAAIFEAHAMILDDPTLRDAVKRRIDANLLAEEAVKEATEEIAAIFSAMENELFAARAADVLDLGRRLLRILLDVQDTSLDALTKPSIVVAYDLTPSDTASLEPEMTLGFCTAAGGLTSHTAILARTLGIPAVVGLGSESFRQIADGASLALDGSTGEVVVDPSEERLKRYEASQAQFLEQQAVMQAAKVRLRPILMTTAAMIAGLIPLLYAAGAGAAQRFSIGIVIVAGLAIGTLFTLFVLPVIYTFLASEHKPLPEFDESIPAKAKGSH